MKSTIGTAALVSSICAGFASAQVSEAAGMRASVPIEIGRYDLNLGGTIHRVATPVGQRTPFSFESSLRVPRGASGFWLGARVEGAPEVDSTPMLPLLGAGFWTTLRRVTVSIGGATHAARVGGRRSTLTAVTRRDSTPDGYWKLDTLSGGHDTVFVETGGFKYFDRPAGTRGDSGQLSRVTLWSDIEGRLGWTVGRASMEAVIGTRPRIAQYAPVMWGRVEHRTR